MAKVISIHNDDEAEQLRNGDQNTYRRVYDRCWVNVRNSIVMKSPNRDEDDARDAYQEAFVALLESLGKPQFKLESNVCTYLYRVAHNYFYKSLRRLKYETDGEILDFKGQEDYEADEQETYERDLLGDFYDEIDLELSKDLPELEEVLSVLNTKMEDLCRNLILDFYFTDLDWEELAKEHGFSNAGAARTRKSRCMTSLREHLGV